MKDRIKLVMESQHMTQQTFAQFLNLNPASISSIFNGRTKPTLNIVDAIHSKIPSISVEWLMFGSGSMYADKSSAPSSTDSNASSSLDDGLVDFEAPSQAPVSSLFDQPQQPRVNSTPNNIEKTVIKYIDKPSRSVSRITIFYSDGMFESFVPEKK